MSQAPRIEPDVLSRVVAAYPDLGAFEGIARNGLSINTAACLFTTDRGEFFAKRYDPSEREPVALLAEHGLILRLIEKGFPTPRLWRDAAGSTLHWAEGQPYALFEKARGEDRYAQAPVFAPCTHPAETFASGAALAKFHLALADAPAFAPKPFKGITARFRVMASPSVPLGLAALEAEAPLLVPFLAEQGELVTCLGWLSEWHRRIKPYLSRLPRGVIHGDFIKRNLFWQEAAISDVIDFDLWNVDLWVFDLALSLIPSAFEWPAILAGRALPNGEHLRAFLAGYQSVRRLEPFERAVLPWVVSSARFEFYLSLVARGLERGDRAEAERFWRLLVDTLGWFAAHPRWHEAIAP
ncbi:phosphotransferase [bacterium]|nr:phosphotransferase [bacterium]